MNAKRLTALALMLCLLGTVCVPSALAANSLSQLYGIPSSAHEEEPEEQPDVGGNWLYMLFEEPQEPEEPQAQEESSSHSGNWLYQLYEQPQAQPADQGTTGGNWLSQLYTQPSNQQPEPEEQHGNSSSMLWSLSFEEEEEEEEHAQVNADPAAGNYSGIYEAISIPGGSVNWLQDLVDGDDGGQDDWFGLNQDLLMDVGADNLLDQMLDSQNTADDQTAYTWIDEDDDSDPLNFLADFLADHGDSTPVNIVPEGETNEDYQFADPEAESMTVMLYIIGSDLETEHGCATDDIMEIMDADLGGNVNVVIQTGGADQWKLRGIDGETCQRFTIRNGNLHEEQDLGLVNMMKPETLSDFISWSAESFPAQRYALILWDHGGGTLLGFGADEHFPLSEMMISDMAKAFKDGGVHFDFIGFDACLMSTVEIAAMMVPYADYLIASEETEPGEGWYYTNWITAVGRNPGLSTLEIGKIIVDDYVYGPDVDSWDELTMAVVDLSKVPALMGVMAEYMGESAEVLDHGDYSQLASARSRALGFGEGEYDQIDIVDYVERAGVTGGSEVISAVDDAVVYYRGTVSDACGLAMYYPYDYPKKYSGVLKELQSIGVSEEYLSFFTDFVSVLVSSRTTRSSGSPMTAVTGYEQEPENDTWDYTQEGWYNPQTAQNTAIPTLDSGEIFLQEKDGEYVLSLTPEQWDIVAQTNLQVYIDDGEGYIDLGLDNVYSFDGSGNLIVDFDYTWVAMDGQIVPFYAEEEGYKKDGTWYTYGYVPAELNGAEKIELMVYWDEEHDGGYVAGYRMATDELQLPGRQLSSLRPNDKLAFFCSYYGYDGAYDGSYQLGGSVTVGKKMPRITYEEIDEYPTLICYQLIDIYGNEYWTETIELSFE